MKITKITKMKKEFDDDCHYGRIGVHDGSMW